MALMSAQMMTWLLEPLFFVVRILRTLRVDEQMRVAYHVVGSSV